MRSKRRVVFGLTLLMLGGIGALVVGSNPPPMRSSLLAAVSPDEIARITSHAVRPDAVVSPTSTPLATPTPRSVTAVPAEPEIVAVGSRTDQTLALIDTKTSKVSGQVDIGMPVQSMTLTPDGQTAWVFSSKPGDLDFVTVDLLRATRVDTRRLRNNPSSAAFSTDGQRAYVALQGGNDSPPAPSSVVFVDGHTAGEFGHIDVGQQSPGAQIQRRLGAVAVARAPRGDIVYAAGRASGTVWALDGGSGALVRQIETGGGPIAVLADPTHQRVYVVADTSNELVAIDAKDQTIVNRLSLPVGPTGAALAPNGALYVSGGSAGQVFPIDLGNWRIGAPIAVGTQPSGLAISLDGGRAYVALSGEGAVATVDLATRKVISKVSAGKDPSVVLVTRASVAATTNATARPTPAPNPTATPTMVPSPTALPDAKPVPEHLPSRVVTETFMSADFPVALAFAPDGRLFYNELHTGKIRVVQNGALLPDAFYQFKVSGEPEAGLIGLTLDPDFETNHYVYVFYTSVPEGQDTGGPNGPNEVVRLTEVDNMGTQLTPILADLPSGPIHNSGTLRFGPDGKLYVSLGDNDHGSNAQDLGTLAGKILRVNPDGSVPDDNPFVGQPGKQAAIWAYGFRNAWSFDFDPVLHRLFATHNGPGDNDELDLVLKGANYGWPPTGYKYTPGVVDPISVFNPTIAPTGMVFYTGDLIASWKNDWFYCNYHQGQLRRVHLAPESRDRVVFDEVVKNGCDLNVANAPDGALYFTDMKGIYRLRSEGATGLIPVVPKDRSAAAAPTAEVLPAGTRAEDRDLNASLTEWKLEPSRAKLPSGQIRVLAENTGRAQHALRIVGQGLDVSTDAIDPGDSRTLQITLAPGEYRLVCPIPGHEQQGMAATLTVVGP